VGITTLTNAFLIIYRNVRIKMINKRLISKYPKIDQKLMNDNWLTVCQARANPGLMVASGAGSPGRGSGRMNAVRSSSRGCALNGRPVCAHAPSAPLRAHLMAVVA
jgi:hypothetical protein